MQESYQNSVWNFKFGGRSVLCRSLDEVYLIWFEASRNFLIIQEPVWFVFQNILSGMNKTKLVSDCTVRYDLATNECIQFVDDLEASFNQLSADKEKQEMFQRLQRSSADILLKPCFQSTYCFNGKFFSIRYYSEYIKFNFHPMLVHNQTDNFPPDVYTIDLYSDKESYYLTLPDNETERWLLSDMAYFKGAVWGKIINSMFLKTEKDWMMTLHASGVTDGVNTMLFSAAAGSGKSTFSSLLQAHGYQLLSDDFISVDNNGMAYSFPFSISVKNGALPILSPYYPQLDETEEELASTGKMVRYLTPSKPVTDRSSFPIKYVVLISYKADASFVFTQMDKAGAVQKLLTEVWVNPLPGSVEAFMSWLDGVEFFELTYSDHNQALDAVKKFFPIV